MTAGPRGPRKLVLLHLSDIHLRKEEIESTQDLDQDIRAKLLHDLARSVPSDLAVDAILVTGDLAFGGKEVEYVSARQWLKTVCAKVRCPDSQIWLVPGNHDKDRDVITKSAMIRDMHSAIRREGNQAGSALADRLRDRAAAQALLSPFVEYNRFAEQFQCETTAGSVYWESTDQEDDLTLNDGSHLRLRGINSSIISDKSGDNGPPTGPATEVIGLKQVQLDDHVDGVCYLTMCHHPPDWLLDGDAVSDYLTSRARIQLFGHKHRQRVRQHDKCIVLGSGALHPDRKEAGWEPRYNVLCLEVLGEGASRQLHVEVYQRAWKAADTDFGKDVGADDEYPKKFDLPLPPWSRPQSPPVAGGEHAPPEASVSTEHEKKASMISIRELVFQFFALSYPVRMRILLDLHLVDDEDDAISDSELVRRAIKRARERDLLLQLEGAIKSVSKPKE